MESAEKENLCLFCKNKFEGKPVIVYSKGPENIRWIAKKNHDFALQEEIKKNHELERLYWYMLFIEDDSQINEKVLIENLQTVKG